MRISDWSSDVCSSDLRDDPRFTLQIVTQDILTKLAQMPAPAELADGVVGVLLDAATPDLVFASRYNGPLATELVRACRRRNIPYIFHLDDNLMEVSQIGRAHV